MECVSSRSYLSAGIASSPNRTKKELYVSEENESLYCIEILTEEYIATYQKLNSTDFLCMLIPINFRKNLPDYWHPDT